MVPYLNIVIKMGLIAAYVLGIRGTSWGKTNSPGNEQERAYTEAIVKRAEAIISTLDLDDAAKASRVRDLIVQQYRSLREIHDARDSKVAEAKDSPERNLAAAWIKVAQDEAALKLVALHRQFVARLTSELTLEQVEKVKDVMTYGVVPNTYRRYLELLPTLSEDQKRTILANLVEAREYAMDAGSSEEKHAIFGKYKGRINNYLSAAGYDLKQAERDHAARQQRDALAR